MIEEFSVIFLFNDDFFWFFLYLHTPIRYRLCKSYFLGIEFSVNNVKKIILVIIYLC